MATAINIVFRPEQLSLYESRRRFDIRVCHRRFGKTWQIIAELFHDANTTQLGDFRGHFAAPTFKQAKRNAWDYLKSFSRNIPGVQINEAELRVDYPNGARIQLLGAEQFDSLRGQFSDHFATDETQLIPPAAFSSVIRPMLADRKGRFTAMGTPAGRHNLLFELLDYAQAGTDEEWRGIVVPVTETNIVDPSELASMKRQMSEAEYNQELLCSFAAAIRGAYFAKEAQLLETEGRFTEVRYDANAPLYIALDLGWSDLMVAHWLQPCGTEHHLIRTIAYQETKIGDMVNAWRDFDERPDGVILPHDAEVHELTTGTTRQQTFENHGCETTIAPRVRDKHEGINQVRDLIAHLWIDHSAKMTLEAIYNYRADYDDRRRVVKMTPVHDWSSHYIDALQTYATGRPTQLGFGPMSGEEMARSANGRFWR